MLFDERPFLAGLALLPDRKLLTDGRNALSDRQARMQGRLPLPWQGARKYDRQILSVWGDGGGRRDCWLRESWSRAFNSQRSRSSRRIGCCRRPPVLSSTRL
jgi:hypothetical protein